MKKSEKYIYLSLGLIVLGIVIAGVAFAIMKGNDKDNKNLNVNEGNVDKPTNNDEKVILSDSELQNYLSYVPKYIMDNKTGEINESVYFRPSNIEKLDKKILLGATIYYAKNYTNIGINPNYENDLEWDKKYNKVDIENLFMKLYNQQLGNLEESSENSLVFYGCTSVYYYNNMFYSWSGCGLDIEPLSIISDYNATTEELTIYEYAAYLDYEYNIIDYYTGNKFKTQLSDEVTLDEAGNAAKEYINEHKTEFTKYKHTYKKNDKGYYWYSTEVA